MTNGIDIDKDYWMYHSQCNNCDKVYTNQTLMNMGWECPNCGGVDWRDLEIC